MPYRFGEKSCMYLTWFFPLSISRLVTFPKGSPRLITSASFMSLGSLRTWTTRDGTPGLRTSPLNFLLSLPLAAAGNRSRYNQERTEGSGSSWIMDCSPWQHKHIHDEHFRKKDSPCHGNPPTWVHDIGSVGYARRKEFVGSPLHREKTMVQFIANTNEDTAQQVESTALILPGPLCDKAGSNLITKRGSSRQSEASLSLQGRILPLAFIGKFRFIFSHTWAWVISEFQILKLNVLYL